MRNLVAQLQDHPGVELIIAASTNTGFARATALYADRHAVVRFPYDFSFAVHKFLDAVQPDAVALVELELWPNFMDACAARGLPVAVVNGRLTARSFKGYRRIRPLITSAFSKLTVAAVQTQDYAQRFIALGTPAGRVKVLDTMKWDTAVVEDTVAGADQLAAELGIDPAKPLIVAGSTAPGEDKLLIDTCPQNAQLLIAPRKPEWFDGVMRHAPDAVRRSSKQTAPAGQRVFLLDTIGELRAAYSLADVCIVGRSFTGELYGSDMMEPIALGKPTIIGPHFSDFADTMKALADAGGIVTTPNPGDAAAELLQNKALAQELADAGRAVILSRQGSTNRHAAMLLELLHSPPPRLAVDQRSPFHLASVPPPAASKPHGDLRSPAQQNDHTLRPSTFRPSHLRPPMPSTDLRQSVLPAAKQVVVKIGTQLITGGTAKKALPAVDLDFIADVARQIAELTEAGVQVTLVSSGAIGAGCVEMGLAKRPTDVAEQQAVAAIGQRALMTYWYDALAKHRLGVGQVLLTRADFDDRLRFLNIRNCVTKLHEMRCIPVLNENDTVAVEEIRFGDNDLLASLMCSALRAQVLILLTSVDGLLDGEGNVIDRVDNVLDQLQHVRQGQKSSWGSGGMQTKLEAARVVVEAGDLAVIASGKQPDIIKRVLSGEARLGTVFAPAVRTLDSRQRWIGLTARPAGAITLDPGAAEAVSHKSKSLLAAGVRDLTGRFERGDVVMLRDPNGREIARGLTNYSADELRLIQGKRSNQIAGVLGKPAYKAVVQREHLVLLGA